MEQIDKQTYFQYWFSWTDWALPLRFNSEPDNEASELQIGPLHLVLFRR